MNSSSPNSLAARSTLLLFALLALSCRRVLNNPADPGAPSYGGSPVTVGAGSPVSSSIGDTIPFGGAFDGDAGRVAEYAWDFDGDGTIDWRSPASPETRHAYPSVGEYRARFVVRGTGGDQEGAERSVTITDESPRGSLGPDTLVAPGDTVTLRPTALDDGRIVRYEWDLDADGTFERVDLDAQPVAVAFAKEGERIVALRLVDDDGRVSTIGRRLGICGLPSEPVAQSPADGSTVPIRYILRWTSDNRCGGGLTYDLAFDRNDPPTRLVLGGASTPAYFTGLLDHSTTYYWRATARDAGGRRSAGPVFSFRTRDVPTTMVYVPGGNVPIGSERNPDEKPLHLATVDGFYIGYFETTREEYALFMAATGYVPRGNFRRDFPAGTQGLPVSDVTWEDAAAYVAWRGFRLPTEAEWELAAAGPRVAIFPWGNFVPRRICDFVNATLATGESCDGGLAPAASRAPGRSWISAANMSGNAAEWVADWYDPTYYTTPLARVLPTGPVTGDRKVVRGGSFRSRLVDCAVTRRRSVPPDSSGDDIGFRYALSLDAPISPAP